MSVQVGHLNTQPEMKHKHRGRCAGMLEHGVFARCPEDSSLWFAEAKIAGLHEAETFLLERAAEIRQGVGEGFDLHCPIGAPEGASPSPARAVGCMSVTKTSAPGRATRASSLASAPILKTWPMVKEHTITSADCGRSGSVQVSAITRRPRSDGLAFARRIISGLSIHAYH